MSQDLRQRQAVISGLLGLASFLTTHPDVPCVAPSVGAWVANKAELQQAAAGGGNWKKKYQDSMFYLQQEFSGGITLSIYASRSDVCERIVVGTREVEERVVPAHTEEIVEWRCSESSLMAAASEAV